MNNLLEIIMKPTSNYWIVFLFLTQILFANPNDIGEGIHLFEVGKYSEARSFFSSYIEKYQDDARGYFYMGRICIQENNHKNAEKWLKKAVELDALNSDFHLWLGRTYGMRTRDASIFKKPFLAKKSKKHFELAVKLDSTNADAVEGVIYYYLYAPGLFGGNKDKAVELSKRLMRLSEPQGRIVQARIYETKKEWQLAEEQYEFLEQNYGDSTEYYYFYNNYGYFLMRQNKITEAISKFEKQVIIAPDKANPHDSLGEAYKAVGRLEESANSYRKALEINPNMSSAKKNLKKVEKDLKKTASK